MKLGSDAREECLGKVEAALEYRFRRKELLDQALTHKSFAFEAFDEVTPGTYNERLEFLGDAIVGFVVAELIFRRFPEDDEGLLTRLRAQLVCTETMVEIARQIDLGQALRYGRGVAKPGEPLPASLFEDALEAVMAAVFLDGGWEAAHAVIRRLWTPRLEALAAASQERLAGRDPKTALQEHFQSLGEPLPGYRLLRSYGPDHAKTFECEVIHRGRALAVGRGRSKKEAEKEAARRALLGLNAPGEE